MQIKTFTDRFPFLGPIIWMLAIQYFLVQAEVASVWKTPFSLRFNTISDLGNTSCGQYGGRFVCSPLHSLMNASLIALGITMALGSILIYQEFRETKASFVGFTLMSAAGLGTLLVGMFPENRLSYLHVSGAILAFLVGNLSILILGLVLDMPTNLRTYTLMSAVVALLALVLFATHHYLGLGIGGMERLTSYPQTLWLIVFGVYLSRNHMKRLRKRSAG